MSTVDLVRLRSIKNFPELTEYLRDELDWPIESEDFDDLTFDYESEELGLDDKAAVKIKKIKQLRPLVTNQPWGIFFVEFEKKKLPVVVLRRILSHLVVKKRASANKGERAVWQIGDLLFISAFGYQSTEQREIAFAHFQQESGDLPTLRVLGWDGADTVLKLEHVAATLKEKLCWPKDELDHDDWRKQWSSPFRHKTGHVIRTANMLAEALAALARGIRERAHVMLQAESDHGPLTKLYKAFQTALIHDLTEESFADTYAQTVTYGLLTAAISRTDMSAGRHGTALIAANVTDMVPITNPFLREMLDTFLKIGGRKNGIDFDELGIQDVVELLRGDETDLPAILRDFGNRTRGEDPVIHFYEHFLSAYNKQLKIQRGVFYTPQPVVSYIVRSVHELLQTEFGLEDGLASTVTWSEMLKRQPGLKLPLLTDEPNEKRTISPNEPFVQILDPATGTATFLVEAIDVIYQTMTEKWKQQRLNQTQQQATWNDYVPKHLLPRLHGYELMMAPYAIAHMKIGLKLYETGYHFGSDERARIYLTNALEPPQDFSDRLAFDAPALAHEAQAVNAIKRHQRFTVVIGNPPYANFGQLNRIPFILDLLQEYKRDLNERKINLDDDYIKFLRYAHWQIIGTGVGLVGFITNHSYLDGVTHRAMRAAIARDFNQVHILNLHGSGVRTGLTSTGVADENVFEIKQGVAITLLASIPMRHDRQYSYGQLVGTRIEKYRSLGALTVKELCGQPLQPEPRFYFFVPHDTSASAEYATAISLPDLMPLHNSGIQTKQDALSIHFTKAELQGVLNDLRLLPLQSLRAKYQVGPDGRDWQLGWAKDDVRRSQSGHVVRVAYRPFDIRFTFYTGHSKGFVAYPRHETSKHFLAGPNVGLCTLRQTVDNGFRHVLAVQDCNEANILISHHVSQQTFPLYLYPEEDLLSGSQKLVRVPNLSSTAYGLLATSLGLTTLTEGKGDCQKTVGPEDIFHYVYAVFHSPSYRSRYAEFLKIDFPRLPLTGNLELFRALARLGGELVALHLMESPKLDKHLTKFVGSQNPEVEKVSWSNDTVWLDKAQTTGFVGVPEAVWNFHIGGYQVCEKWLKDRKGRTLSKDDIAHYPHIVVALSETIRLMVEIDKVIEKYGGWPDAFKAGEQ